MTRRSHGEGTILQRGDSFRLRYRIGKQRYSVTVRGSISEARKKLRELLKSGDDGTHVEPSKITVAEFVRDRVNQWEASEQISARTAERHRYSVENQVVPHIGEKQLQKLRPLDIETWHTTLRTKGRAGGKAGSTARTIGHAHRVLSKALNDAVKNNVLLANPAKVHAAPKVPDVEMFIAQDVPDLVAKLAVSAGRLYVPAM